MADDDQQVAAVRLLINDPTGVVFDDNEIAAFLELEGGVVKRAAAQAIDTIADNEALVSKVIKDGDLSTNGAQTADSLRKRAATLRAQAVSDKADQDAESGEDSFFGLTNFGSPHRHGPELTERPSGFFGGHWSW